MHTFSLKLNFELLSLDDAVEVYRKLEPYHAHLQDLYIGLEHEKEEPKDSLPF